MARRTTSKRNPKSVSRVSQGTGNSGNKGTDAGGSGHSGYLNRNKGFKKKLDEIFEPPKPKKK